MLSVLHFHTFFFSQHRLKTVKQENKNSSDYGLKTLYFFSSHFVSLGKNVTLMFVSYTYMFVKL